MQFHRILMLSFTLIFSLTITLAQSPDPIIPPDGTWEINLIGEENTCPSELPLEDAWMPESGSQHILTFSTLEDVPLDIHRIVAPLEIAETPEFFSVTEDEYNQYEITPEIQTQPYLYRYAVLEEEYIVLEYIETLSLSDCVLTATYSITFVSSNIGETDAENVDTRDATSANIESWTVGGDSTDPTFVFDDSNPDGAICGSDRSTGETWFFSADEGFVSEVNASYGQTLSYDIRITSGNLDNTYDDFDVELVVGNGIVLHYSFDYFPTDEWTHFEVILDETAGWIDVDGVIPTDDAELFPQIVQDITGINIRGEYITGSDSACIANIQIGNPDSDTDEPVGIDAVLESGQYEVVLVSIDESCTVDSDTTMLVNIEFTYMGDDNFLAMLIEGNPEPVIFTLTEDQGVYRVVEDDPAVLIVLSETEFLIESEDGCDAIIEGTLQQ